MATPHAGLNHRYGTRRDSEVHFPPHKPLIMANAAGPYLNFTPATWAWLHKQVDGVTAGGGGAPAAEPNKLAEMARVWEKGLAQLKAKLGGAEEGRCCTHCTSTGAHETDRSHCCTPCFALGLLGLLLVLLWAWLGRR